MKGIYEFLKNNPISHHLKMNPGSYGTLGMIGNIILWSVLEGLISYAVWRKNEIENR